MKKQQIIIAIVLTASLFMATSRKNIHTNQLNLNSTFFSQNNISPTDRQFVLKAAQDGLTEVELGNLATQLAQSQEVKDFGRRMVEDHTQLNNELKDLAAQKGINLPMDIGAENNRIKADLARLEGEDFDRNYINRMVIEHNQDVALFQRQARQGNDRDLRNWAARSLPIFQEHLQLARSIQDRLKR
jgi:putative membrane protein